MKEIPSVQVSTDYIKFGGGLDQITPALSIKPGFVVDAVNYEPDVFGGYRRIDGYERYSGLPSPSDATYYYAPATFSGTPVVGDTITGSTSAATAEVALVGDDYLILTMVSGTFNAGGEAFTGGGGGTLTSTPIQRGQADAEDDAIALNAAADRYRQDIAAIAGSGDTLGVHVYKGNVYAFRNNAGGTAAVMWRAYPQRRSLAFTLGGTIPIAAGDTVTGSISGATAVIEKVVVTSGSWGLGTAVGTLYFLTQTGDFQAENLDVGVSPDLATIAGNSTDIKGWNAVDLGRYIAFTSGGVTEIAEGNTITGATSAATAVVTKVYLTSGSWAAGTAAGILYLRDQVGTFQAENLDVGASLNLATIAGNSTALTLSPSGRYEAVNYNFTGSQDTLKMYGCDGVNRAFEYDGTEFIPIHSGMTTDTPKFIAAYRNMLFLAFRGSLQNSGVGNPFSWSPVTGADELAAGDEITGLLVQPESLLLFLRHSSHQLTGSSVDNFVLSPLASDMGAIPYTAQNIGMALSMDDRGLVAYMPGQDYGNFNFNTVSRQVQKLVDELRPNIDSSVVYRNRNQYRVFAPDYSDNQNIQTRGLIVTVEGRKIVGITELDYPIWITCACSGEDATGKDVAFFGASNGTVYQLDKGSSFDGDEIEAYLRMPFNNLRSPRHLKRYRKMVMEMSCESYCEIRFQPEFDYGDADRASHRIQDQEATGPGGYWDADDWESFFYDARIVAAPEFGIEGTGLNMSMLFYSNSEIDLGHTLQGALVHYTIRRLQR